MKHALIAILSLTSIAAQAADLSVADAFSRATAGAGPGAAYLTIHGGDAPDRLLSVRSPRAASVGLHTMTMDGAVMRMRQLDGIDVPAGATIRLAPGSLHLMLQGLKAPLKPGETVPLTLTFQKAGERQVEAPVGPIGATMPGPAAHAH